MSIISDNDIEFLNIFNQETDLALCSVLRIGNIRIMLDCGCNEQLDQSMLDLVLEHARNVNFILLSQSSWMHLGALPYLYKNGVTAKIVTTSPISKMGAHVIHELYISKKESPTIKDGKPVLFNAYNLHDVENCFRIVELVSFQEKKSLKEGNTEIVVMAIPSGNSVGGSAWNIWFNHLKIVYAVDINDKQTPISVPMQPSAYKGANLMISNGYIVPELYGSTQTKVYNFVNEDKLLKRLEDVLIDRMGNMLIPISNKNRILHMLILLE
jgi:cleavage and polyadenylation specificity factor subunit 2